MKQRIVISGRGGQGILTLTRVLAEAAALAGHEVITTETHGMAQRGGTVLSMVKVGPFRGPLIVPGEAEVGLFLSADSLPVHSHYLRPGAPVFVNATPGATYATVDADGLMASAGQRVGANLVLLGYAAAKGGLFARPEHFEKTLREATPAKHLEASLQAFRTGVEAGR